MTLKIEINRLNDEITFACSCGQTDTVLTTSLTLVEKTAYVAADSLADPPILEEQATYFATKRQYECQNVNCNAMTFLEI